MVDVDVELNILLKKGKNIIDVFKFWIIIRISHL